MLFRLMQYENIVPYCRDLYSDNDLFSINNINIYRYPSIDRYYTFNNITSQIWNDVE